ncbi:MAG: YIP1 family protein, partial [Acidobacteria bacterium]|nr:YIP1 family protein [Acidobacteriota bacterium]
LAVSSLIGIPILLAKEPDAVDLRNVVMANPSFLFDQAEQHKLYMVASSFDLFSFWVIALMAIGISRLTGKSRGAALLVVLIPWALYVAIGKAWLG